MKRRLLGRDEVGCVGLGTAPLSLRPDRPSDDQGVAVIHASLDAGVTLLDTADVYTPPGTGRGHSERLIARALRYRGLSAGDGGTGRGDGVVVATKGGKFWDADGEVRIDARPASLRRACEASLRALSVETIHLYQLHEVDPVVPIEDSVGALVELQQAGKIAQIGLSNVTLDELNRALRIAPIVSVQNRYSPIVTESDEVLARCTERGIAFLPWGPLTGFRGDAEDAPGALRFTEAAARRGVSVQRVVLAWELARAPVMIPIPGATRTRTAVDSAAAAELELSADEVAWLSDADGDTPSGRPLTRAPEEVRQSLDSPPR